MTTATTLTDRYAEVRGRIDEAARRSGRSQSEILFVAVTKYAEPEQVRELMHLGHIDFGESRVQQLVQRASLAHEYLDRIHTAPSVAEAHDETAGKVPESVRWHMIGHLQRNKVKKAMEHARLIHSVHSLRLAEDIQQTALRMDKTVDLLLQVNCSGEPGKQGITTPAAPHVAEQICTMVNVRLCGLMAMAPLDATQDELRIFFDRGKETFDDIRRAGFSEDCFTILSMGMSNDYELAIEHGSNCVRVGTALFGKPEGGDEEEGAE